MAELRRYPLGKFRLMLDTVVYDAVMDGGSKDFVGDAEELGAFDLVTLRGEELPLVDCYGEAYEWTPGEKRFWGKQHSAILMADNSGFINVEYFETAEAAEAAWSLIEDEYNAYYAEAEAEAE